MGGSQPAKHWAQHRHNGMWRHGTTFYQQLAQGTALDELHHQKRVPAVFALVVDRDQRAVI
ncbi:Uncharacterised protein [Mycobacterium tuberculosis]|nr:Uncharacterised protein [Mycobacterium tuberculosis]